MTDAVAGSELLAGSAEAAGTRRFARCRDGVCPPGHFREVFGLSLSSIGVGTARGGIDDATNAEIAESVWRCIGGGVNYIDAASNYRGGRSERAVGTALKRACTQDGEERAGLIVATKAGYLPLPPGTPRETAKLHLDAIGCGEVAAETFDGSHCLHPTFLAHEVAQSRINLGLSTIDIVYLHNPEVQLTKLSRLDFHARLRRSFAFLEQQCDDGKIARYGVATWHGLRVPRGHVMHLNIAELRDLAVEVGGERHRFAVVQAPFNPMQPEIFMPTQEFAGRMVSTVEAARELGLVVIASATLGQGRAMPQLRQLVGDALWQTARSDPQRALQFARSLPHLACSIAGVRASAHVSALLDVVREVPFREERLLASLDEAGGRSSPASQHHL